jgi:hypothetical protein
MNASGKVVFYSIVARNSGFISVLAHPWGGVSGKNLGIIHCRADLSVASAPYFR